MMAEFGYKYTLYSGVSNDLNEPISLLPDVKLLLHDIADSLQSSWKMLNFLIDFNKKMTNNLL